MFSCVKVHHKTHGHLRGSPLLHQISQQQHKHPHLRIVRVQTCPGHVALFLDGGRCVVVLDNVPKSIIRSTSVNEEVSLRLFSELLLLNEHQINQEMQTSQQAQPVQTIQNTVNSKTALSIEGIRNMTNIEGIKNMTNTTNQFVKKNFTKLLDTIATPTMGNWTRGSLVKSQQSEENIQYPQPQPQQQQQQQEEKLRPLFLLNNLDSLRADGNLLAFCDFSSPISYIFFDEDNNSMKIYALQRNGLLWRWYFDNNEWLWKREGSGRSILTSRCRIQHATFITASRTLLYSQIDAQGRASLWSRRVNNLEWDWDVGSSVFLTHVSNDDTERPVIANIFELREGRDAGAWIFTEESIHYVYEPNVEQSTISAFGGKFIHSVLKNVTDMKAVKPSPQDTNQMQKALATAVVPSLYYCSKYVHPLSGELVLLDLHGQIHLWSPKRKQIVQRTLNSSSLFMSTSLNSYYDVMSRHSKFVVQLEKFNQSQNNNALQTLKKEAQRCRRMNILETFMVHDSILCVTNQDTCFYIEPRTCTSLGQTQLPNDIVLDAQGSNDMYDTDVECKNAALKIRTVLWELHRDSIQMGVFCGQGIYELKSPPMSDLLKQTAEYAKSSGVFGGDRVEGGVQDRDKYRIAMIAKQWKLEEWHVKYLLDLIIEERDNKNKNTASSRVKDDKKSQVLKDLCKRLENPSLVWTGTTCIAEQEILIKQLANFVRHFPAPDSSFWSTEKQHSIDQQSWEETLSSLDSDPIDAESTLERLTVLNLSVVPTLSKSLSISKTQIENLSQVKRSITTREEQLIQDMTDAELYDLMHVDADRVLMYLCKKYGLQSLLDAEDSDIIDGHRVYDLCNLDPSFMNSFDNDCEENDERSETDRFNDDISLHFDMITELLFRRVNRPHLVACLAYVMDKWKRDQLETELSQLRNELKALSVPITNKGSKKLNGSDAFQQEQARQYQQQLCQQKINACTKKLKINQLERYSKRFLDYLNVMLIVGSEMKVYSMEELNDDQLRTIARLTHWSGNLLSAVRMYLSRHMTAQAIEILNVYVQKDISIEEKYELLHTLIQYCMKSDNKELWQIVWKIIPDSYNVFDFMGKFYKEENQQKKNIFIAEGDDDDLKIETIMPGLKKF